MIDTANTLLKCGIQSGGKQMLPVFWKTRVSSNLSIAFISPTCAFGALHYPIAYPGLLISSISYDQYGMVVIFSTNLKLIIWSLIDFISKHFKLRTQSHSRDDRSIPYSPHKCKFILLVYHLKAADRNGLYLFRDLMSGHIWFIFWRAKFVLADVMFFYTLKKPFWLYKDKQSPPPCNSPEASRS